MTKTVAAQGNYTGEGDVELLSCRRYAGDKPGYFCRVCEAEDEFVDDAIDTNGAGDER